MKHINTIRISHKKRNRRLLGGFSLVEIMVGLVIGLLGIIVMEQMLSVSESQKRTTSGSDDAQNSGAIALYGLQRDIQLGGYGISGQNSGNTPNLLGCSVTLRAGVILNAIAPVTINPQVYTSAGTLGSVTRDANTDALMVVYGNSNGPQEGDSVSGQPSQTIYSVGTPTSYTAADRVIAQYGVRQSPCNGLFLDTVNSIAAPNVTVATGVANITTTNAAAGVTPTLFDLGPSPIVKIYAVRNGSLTVCDYMVNDCGATANMQINTANQAIYIPIAGNIVDMEAEYGRDTTVGTMTGIADTWDQTTPTTACLWARTPAVRVALVARGNLSSTQVIAASPTWLGSAVDPINLSALPNWQNYHYKVFQTVSPIRNITMQGVIAGC